MAQGIEQGATGIARVDGGVGLDNPADFAIAGRLNFPAQCADDAGGERGIQAEGIADGQYLAAHRQLRGISQGQGCQVVGWLLDPQHGQVLFRCHADNVGVVFSAILQGDGQLVSSSHHVEIGHDEAVRVPDKPGAGAAG